jgi:hypothetical protein
MTSTSPEAQTPGLRPRWCSARQARLALATRRLKLPAEPPQPAALASQEILAFALAFNLPLVWFFLPPPGDRRTLERTTNSVSELYGILFGHEDQLGPLYHRLRQLGIDEPGEVDKTIENITGKPSRVRQTSYQQRRKEMLLALLDQYSDDVDRAADEMGAFFDHLRQVGVRGFVPERLDDPDYVYRPKTKKPGRTTRG